MSINVKEERSSHLQIQTQNNLSLSSGGIRNEIIRNITTIQNKGDSETRVDIEKRMRKIMSGKNPSLCPHILQEYFKRVGEVIQAYRPQIVQYVKYEQVSESLIQRGILRRDENILVQEIETSEMQMERILDILQKRMWGLENLITVLIEINVESWLVEEMFQKYVHHIVNEIRRLQSLKSCKCFEHERRSIIRKAVIRFFEKCDEWLYTIGTSMGFLTLTIYPKDNVLQFINNLLPIPREKNDEMLSIPGIEFVRHKINDGYDDDDDDGTVDIIEVHTSEKCTSSGSTKPLTDIKSSSLSTLSTESKIRGHSSKSSPTKLSMASSTSSNMHMEEKAKAIQTSMSEPTVTVHNRSKLIKSKSPFPSTSNRFTPTKATSTRTPVHAQTGELVSMASPAERSTETAHSQSDENKDDDDNTEYFSQVVLLPMNIKFLSKNGEDPRAVILNSIPNFQNQQNLVQGTPTSTNNNNTGQIQKQMDSWMTLSDASAFQSNHELLNTQSLNEISTNDTTNNSNVPQNQNLIQDSRRVSFKPILPLTQSVQTIITNQNDHFVDDTDTDARPITKKNLISAVHLDNEQNLPFEMNKIQEKGDENFPVQKHPTVQQRKREITKTERTEKEAKNMKPTVTKPMKILSSRTSPSLSSKITSKLSSPSKSKILHKATSQSTKNPVIKKSTISAVSKTSTSNVKSVKSDSKNAEAEKDQVKTRESIEKRETEKTLDSKEILCESLENKQILSLTVSDNQAAIIEASNCTQVAANEDEINNDTEGTFQIKESHATEAEDLKNNDLTFYASKPIKVEVTNISLSPESNDLNTTEDKINQHVKSTEEVVEVSTVETTATDKASPDFKSPEKKSTVIKSPSPRVLNSTKVAENKTKTNPTIKSSLSSSSKLKQSSATQKSTTVNSSIRKSPVMTTPTKSTRVSVFRSTPDLFNRKSTLKAEATKKKPITSPGKPILKKIEKTLENNNETSPSKQLKVVKIVDVDFDCNNNINNSPSNAPSSTESDKDIEKTTSLNTSTNDNDHRDEKSFNSTLVLDTLNRFADSTEKFPILKKNLVDLNGTFGEIRGKINSLSNLLSEKQSKYFPNTMRRTKSDSLISTPSQDNKQVQIAIAKKIRISSESATGEIIKNNKIMEPSSCPLQSAQEPQQLIKKWKNTINLDSHTESHSDSIAHTQTPNVENNDNEILSSSPTLEPTTAESSSSTSSLEDFGQSKLLVDAASQTVLKMKATPPSSPLLSKTPLGSSSPAAKSPAATMKNTSYSTITSKVNSHRSPSVQASTTTATNKSTVMNSNNTQRVAKVSPNQSKPAWNSSKKPPPPPQAPERVDFSNIEDYNFTIWTNNWQAKADKKRNDEDLANLINKNK